MWILGGEHGVEGVQNAGGVLALAPHVLGSLSAWISKEFGIGIAPRSGIAVAPVLPWWFSPRV